MFNEFSKGTLEEVVDQPIYTLMFRHVDGAYNKNIIKFVSADARDAFADKIGGVIESWVIHEGKIYFGKGLAVGMAITLSGVAMVGLYGLLKKKKMKKLD